MYFVILSEMSTVKVIFLEIQGEILHNVHTLHTDVRSRTVLDTVSVCRYCTYVRMYSMCIYSKCEISHVSRDNMHEDIKMLFLVIACAAAAAIYFYFAIHISHTVPSECCIPGVRRLK